MTSGKLLRNLIKSGAEGNFEAFRHASKEVIRLEREKKHHLLTNDLEKILYGRTSANKSINETIMAQLPTDRELKSRLDAAIQQTTGDEGGFDERRLFRFAVEKGFDPELLRHISPEIEFVSQEQDEVVVAFVTSAALESFEARLSSMVKGERVLPVENCLCR